MRALRVACGVGLLSRTTTIFPNKQPWIARRWATNPKVLADRDDDSPLASSSLEEDVERIDMLMHDTDQMSTKARRNWIDRILPTPVRFLQDTTDRALQHSIYSGDLAQVESAYKAFRKSSLELEDSVSTDAAHNEVIGFPSARIQTLLAVRETLSMYSTEPAERIKATMDEDLHRIWLPMLSCETYNGPQHVVKRLARLNYLDEAAAILTQYARRQGLSSKPELLREAAIHLQLWQPIFHWHCVHRSSPAKISKLLLHATGLGLPVDRMLCEDIIQYYLRCQPYPHQELATCFDLMSDSQVEFEEGTHGLKLLWMLKSGLKTDIDEQVRIIKQAGEEGSLHSPSLNALVIYEARRGNLRSVKRYLDSIRSKAYSLEGDALLALEGFPELDLVHSSKTISTRDDDRAHSRALMWWLKVQQCLRKDTESGLDDRLKQAIAICSAAQEHLEPLGLISVLQPVLALTSWNNPMVDLSTANTALVTTIYDRLVWPDPRTLQQTLHKANVANMIRRFLYIFINMGDMNRFTLLCIQASMLQVTLSSGRLSGLLSKVMKRLPTLDEAATYYEQLQLLQSDGDVLTCLRSILHIPGSSDRPYPSAKFFGRLVKTCSYDQKRRLLKILLRRYLDFLRINSVFQSEETIPGHMANIGAQVRSLHAMVPEEPGWDDFVERQCRTLLMTVYFQTDQFDEAVALWKAFPEERRFELYVLSSFIDGCGRHCKVRIAEEAWDAMRARRQPTANEWGAWLECLCRHSQASFSRARDIMLFQMGTDGGVPAADLGFARTILSFASRYNALEETKGMIKTYLPDVWLQLRAVMLVDPSSNRLQEKALFLTATMDPSTLSPDIHALVRERQQRSR
ncbi:hypothetical protein CALVIDRAFT_601741 [Calocera viscosa TUFC12733]|uniref:Uncharacterized protein n=1 Tax=Calocera viscosa (strain TUFC12733) TaxID=1330018 RepID=A0A167HWV0_CALVF|nr:hypothetical protein CALVIDRAFT_601741 [Calocera viscosa TUFC12733]